jgi:hypothetical protein
LDLEDHWIHSLIEWVDDVLSEELEDGEEGFVDSKLAYDVRKEEEDVVSLGMSWTYEVVVLELTL